MTDFRDRPSLAWRVARGIGITVGVLFLASCALGNGMMWLFQAAWHLVAGWAFFLGRSAAAVRPDPAAIIEFVVVLGVLAVGTHLFARWFAESRGAEPWQPARSAALVAGVVLMFTTSIASAGIAHQLVWLGRSDLAEGSSLAYRLHGAPEEHCRSLSGELDADGIRRALVAEPERYRPELFHYALHERNDTLVLVVGPRDPSLQRSLGGWLCPVGYEQYDYRELDADELARALIDPWSLEE